MEVKVEAWTNGPIDVISRAAGTCYGRDDASETRVRNCYRRGHGSILEHAVVTFEIRGVSRACLAQLSRHRLMSLCVESQRYNVLDVKGTDWYVVPPSMSEDFQSYHDAMYTAAKTYQNLLYWGVKPEDARYALPESTRVGKITLTCNMREFFHFLDLRTDPHAQWEIRELANRMADVVESIDEHYAALIGMWRDGRRDES